MNKEKKSEVHITNNFNAPIGQHIDHVDTINFRMDGDGTFHFGVVENAQMEKKDISDKQLALAIENCQEYFWGNSAYAVVFCWYRDDYEITISQKAFEEKVESLPYSKNRDFRCPAGTIANAFSNNQFYKMHISKWKAKGAPTRIFTLLEKLREQIEL